MSDEAVEALRQYAPLVEVGAGSGYWSYELHKAGVDVIATDPQYDSWRWRPFTKIQRISGLHAVKKYPKRNLLIVWPTYDRPWAAETLAAFSGNIVCYVGEGMGRLHCGWPIPRAS